MRCLIACARQTKEQPAKPIRFEEADFRTFFATMLRCQQDIAPMRVSLHFPNWENAPCITGKRNGSPPRGIQTQHCDEKRAFRSRVAHRPQLGYGFPGHPRMRRGLCKAKRKTPPPHRQSTWRRRYSFSCDAAFLSIGELPRALRCAPCARGASWTAVRRAGETHDGLPPSCNRDEGRTGRTPARHPRSFKQSRRSNGRLLRHRHRRIRTS